MRWAVLGAAAFGVAVWLVTRRRPFSGGPELDFTPAPRSGLPAPAIALEPDEGPVMVTIEYQIDPARAADFAQVMDRTRRQAEFRRQLQQQGIDDAA